MTVILISVRITVLLGIKKREDVDIVFNIAISLGK